MHRVHSWRTEGVMTGAASARIRLSSGELVDVGTTG
jgi:hypothetical protein